MYHHSMTSAPTPIPFTCQSCNGQGSHFTVSEETGEVNDRWQCRDCQGSGNTLRVMVEDEVRITNFDNAESPVFEVESMSLESFGMVLESTDGVEYYIGKDFTGKVEVFGVTRIILEGVPQN